MSRPKNKKELLELSNSNFKRLNELIEAQPDQNIFFPEGTMNRNIRDILTHLHHWHLMMTVWYTTGMKGQKPIMPAPGYTWQQIPALNKTIWEQYQTTTLLQAKRMIKDSFKDLQNIIQKHSDEELFQKKRYFWTGTTSLAAYLISATSSHYDWGYKVIKKALKDK